MTLDYFLILPTQNEQRFHVTFIIDEKKPMSFEKLLFFSRFSLLLSVRLLFSHSILIPHSITFSSLCPKIKHHYLCTPYITVNYTVCAQSVGEWWGIWGKHILSKVSVILRKTIKTAVIYVPHCDEQILKTCKSLHNTRHVLFFHSFFPLHWISSSSRSLYIDKIHRRIQKS